MQNSVLEITEQEYMIKLNKQEFDLSFIHALLKRIQSEKAFFSKIWDDDDIIAKGRFLEDRDIDHLSEK